MEMDGLDKITRSPLLMARSWQNRREQVAPESSAGGVLSKMRATTTASRAVDRLSLLGKSTMGFGSMGGAERLGFSTSSRPGPSSSMVRRASVLSSRASVRKNRWADASEVGLDTLLLAAAELGYGKEDLMPPKASALDAKGLTAEQIAWRLEDTNKRHQKRVEEVRQRALEITHGLAEGDRQRPNHDNPQSVADVLAMLKNRRNSRQQRMGEVTEEDVRGREAAWLSVVVKGRLIAAHRALERTEAEHVAEGRRQEHLRARAELRDRRSEARARSALEIRRAASRRARSSSAGPRAKTKDEIKAEAQERSNRLRAAREEQRRLLDRREADALERKQKVEASTRAANAAATQLTQTLDAALERAAGRREASRRAKTAAVRQAVTSDMLAATRRALAIEVAKQAEAESLRSSQTTAMEAAEEARKRQIHMVRSRARAHVRAAQARRCAARDAAQAEEAAKTAAVATLEEKGSDHAKATEERRAKEREDLAFERWVEGERRLMSYRRAQRLRERAGDKQRRAIERRHAEVAQRTTHRDASSTSRRRVAKELALLRPSVLAVARDTASLTDMEALDERRVDLIAQLESLATGVPVEVIPAAAKPRGSRSTSPQPTARERRAGVHLVSGLADLSRDSGLTSTGFTSAGGSRRVPDPASVRGSGPTGAPNVTGNAATALPSGRRSSVVFALPG